jgi:GNAT superfamily N-acetyltransferase
MGFIMSGNRRLILNDIEYRGYYPGALGKITEIHAVYYHENWGFDLTFETQVARELSEFVGEFDSNRDGLWVAVKAGRFAGAIAIDGRRAFEAGARLRWFIVVPEFQKSGIGRTLISGATQFCKRKGYPRVYLWTFKGLEDARRLYEDQNFSLQEESEVARWGQIIKEQQYVLQIAGNQKG